ncbi:hypothetical protein YC2023_077616 [Brassica napus]
MDKMTSTNRLNGYSESRLHILIFLFLANGNTDAVITESTPTITPSPPVPASRLSQLKESLKLEHQLLRAPFEQYKKTIRSNHRSMEKEVSRRFG